jgi:outer membrane protein
MQKLLLTLLLLISFIGLKAQEKRILSLEECVQIAIDNNLTVKRSELSLISSEINLRQARWQRYPSLNMGANYGYNWGRGIDPVTNLFTTQEIAFNGLSGNANVPVIAGFQITNSITQSKIDQEAAKLDMEKAINDISLNIALTYVNVIFNKELLDNANFQLESSREQLEQTRKLVQAGSLPLSNELQQESQVATNEVNVINAQNTLDLALLSLKQSMLLPPGEEIDIVIPDIDVESSAIDTLSIEEVYSQALLTMPEIDAANKRVESADMGIKVSRGALYPSLNLSAGLSTNYSNAARDLNVIGVDSTGVFTPTRFQTETGVPVLEEQFDVQFEQVTRPLSRQYKDNYSRRVTLNLSIPILNGLNATSNVERSKISKQQAEISVMEQKNILYNDIETAYRNAVAASKTYDSRKKQVEALEETFRTVENQYNLGAANFTDFQVANNNLFQAISDLSRAKYDFIFRQKILEFYLGRPLSF